MSIKKKVSIALPIQTVADNMAMDDIRFRPLMTVYAVEADQKIGSYYSYKKQIAVLDVNNCRAELPCGAVSVLAILMGDHGCDCGTTFINIYQSYVTSPLSMDINLGFGLNPGGCFVRSQFEIQGNCIVFKGNFDGQKITIQYLGYELDKQGLPLINEEHVDAVAQYIEYKFALRSRYKAREFRMDEGAIRSLQMEWSRKCRNARAESAAPDISEMEEITRMMNDPESGIGMAMWCYNAPYWIV